MDIGERARRGDGTPAYHIDTVAAAHRTGARGPPPAGRNAVHRRNRHEHVDLNEHSADAHTWHSSQALGHTPSRGCVPRAGVRPDLTGACALGRIVTGTAVRSSRTGSR